MPLHRLPWLTAAVGVVATAAVIAVIAFGVPDFIMARVAQLTGLNGLLPVAATVPVRVHASRWPQAFDVLPAEVREPLPPSRGVGRLRALRERPALLIETATLVMPPGSQTLRIVTPALTLRDATLVTNGGSLEIETETLDITNSAIRASATDVGAGQGGGKVAIIVHESVRGVLVVDLSGRAGAPGAAGSAGAAGTPGRTGERARSGPTQCQTPAERGGNGTAGAAGAAGGPGAKGSNGGTLEIAAADPLGIAGQVQFSAAGGVGGPGGPGGAGGSGGAAGFGGAPAGVCFGNAPAGQAGAPGPQGPAGKAGEAGAEGAMTIVDLREGG